VKLNDSSGALRATKNSGLQPAMDFILEHNDDPIPDATSSAQPQSEPISVDDEDDIAALGLQSGDASQAGSGAVVEASVSRTYLNEAGDFYVHLTCQSIKCSQCGKIFKNTALANFHAEKSGHDQFEESTEEVRFVWSHFVGQTIFIDEVFFFKDQTAHGRGEKPKVG
jgi:UBX domain-containing protein 1/4